MTNKKTEKMKLKDIVIHKDIYPRVALNKQHVESLVETLRVKDVFDAVMVQRVMTVDGEKTVLIDGRHRLEAYGLSSIDIVNVEHWRDEVLDIRRRDNLEEIQVKAITVSLEGDKLPLNLADKKKVCVRMAKQDPMMTITQEKFAKMFGVHRSTIGDWIGPTRAKQRGGRDGQVYRLSFLGWSQKDIVERIGGITQPLVSDIIRNAESHKIHKDAVDMTVSELAELHALDVPVAWAILTHTSDDGTRFSRFNEELIKDDTYDEFQPIATDVWSFEEHDVRLGSNHELNIPGQIVLRYLLFFTEPHDGVLDPFAGGGTVLDACLVMGRRCRGYDIEPTGDRIDIEKQDILDGILGKYNHIFLDPPQSSFNDILEFSDFMMTVAEHSYNAVKPKGTVALVMSDSRRDGFVPLTDKCCKIFEDTGFRFVDRISCPLPSGAIQDVDDEKATEKRQLVALNRYLLVFQKEEK